VNSEGTENGMHEGYYVTIRRGSRTGLLLGPYTTHGAAEGNVGRAQCEARKIDSWTAFDGFGVTRVRMKPGRLLPTGKLNNRIGLENKTWQTKTP
jgi:hypothetical protein